MQAKMMLGVELNQLIGAFGGGFYFYIIPNPSDDPKQLEQMPQHTTVMLELASPEVFTTLLNSLMNMGLSGMVKKNEYLGQMLFEVPEEINPELQPAFGIVDKFFVFSTSGEELRSLVRRMGSNDYKMPENIRAAAAKVEVMKPEGNMLGFMLSAQESNALIKLSENQMKEALTILNEEHELGLDMDEMPTAEDLKKYFNVDSFISTQIRIVCFYPFPDSYPITHSGIGYRLIQYRGICFGSGTKGI